MTRVRGSVWAYILVAVAATCMLPLAMRNHGVNASKAYRHSAFSTKQHPLTRSAPYPCTCGNETSSRFSLSSPSHARLSLEDPVSLPGDLALHEWAGYETVWYIGQVSSVDQKRRFGVLYMLYAGATPDGMCPSAPGGVWAAIAAPDYPETKHPGPGRFWQDARLAPTLISTADPFTLWDATNQWGLRQLSTSSKWQDMSMEVQSDVDGGFSFSLQLNADIIPLQAMGVDGMTPGGCTQHRGQGRIGTNGTVRLGSESWEVSGTVWYQHMWGTPEGPARTWRWYNAELSDGYSMQFVFFDGAPEEFSYGNVVSPDGRTNTYLAAERIQLEQDPASVWISPHTGRAYNTSSTIRVPDLGIELHYQTWIEDNEVLLTPTATQAVFYEGVSDVWGWNQGNKVMGNGYTERYMG